MGFFYLFFLSVWLGQNEHVEVPRLFHIVFESVAFLPSTEFIFVNWTTLLETSINFFPALPRFQTLDDEVQSTS